MKKNTFYNLREPLPPGTKLNDRFTIEDLLSDCGGTALTYKASIKSGETVIVKESYPLYSNAPIIRNGYKLMFKDDSSDNSAELKKIEEKFIFECDNADLLNFGGDSNSIFHFKCEDITSSVTGNIHFSGTIAKYMCMATFCGSTLEDLSKEEISLKQALIYTKKILLPLQRMHSDLNVLHLDIKNDNIFFPSELKPDETFAILLDCGSAQKICNISTATNLSMSDSFAARELQLFKIYSSEIKNEDAAEKYRSIINTQTDLYSVGAVLFRLIMGNDFSVETWNCINTEDDRFKREQTIKQELERRLSSQYSYLLERIQKLLVRALFFCPFPEIIKTNRFQTCDDFYNEINIVLEILNNEGFHPEIILAKSKENFCEILTKSNLKFSGEPLDDDSIFNEEWFPTFSQQ